MGLSWTPLPILDHFSQYSTGCIMNIMILVDEEQIQKFFFGQTLSEVE